MQSLSLFLFKDPLLWSCDLVYTSKMATSLQLTVLECVVIIATAIGSEALEIQVRNILEPEIIRKSKSLALT